jgi:hypothetical protein
MESKGGGGGVKSTVFPPRDYDTRTDTADGKNQVDRRPLGLPCRLVGAAL